jgi:hypothetical protein
MDDGPMVNLLLSYKGEPEAVSLNWVSCFIK